MGRYPKTETKSRGKRVSKLFQVTSVTASCLLFPLFPVKKDFPVLKIKAIKWYINGELHESGNLLFFSPALLIFLRHVLIQESYSLARCLFSQRFRRTSPGFYSGRCPQRLKVEGGNIKNEERSI